MNDAAFLIELIQKHAIMLYEKSPFEEVTRQLIEKLLKERLAQ